MDLVWNFYDFWVVSSICVRIKNVLFCFTIKRFKRLFMLAGVVLKMRINQLPVSATRCQHGSQICFCNFYLLKNCKIMNNSANNETREKKLRFGILRILENCLTRWRNNSILLNIISHWFQWTIELFNGWNSSIV